MEKTENVPLLSESHAVYCPLTLTKDCILNHYIVFPYIYLYPFFMASLNCYKYSILLLQQSKSFSDDLPGV